MVSINARFDIDVTVYEGEILVGNVGVFFPEQRRYGGAPYYELDGNEGLIEFLEREAHSLLRDKLEQYKQELLIEGQR